MSKEAVSGSHGFLGSHLMERGEFVRLGREGVVPPGMDVVFDLAAYGNMAYHEGERQIYQANLMRVIASMEQLSDETKFIFVSSSSVTRDTQTAYSTSKKAAEEYLGLKVKQNSRVAIVRPYAIVGVGEQKEHLIPKLIHSCFTGEEMPFVPHPVHDFVHVEDVVDALFLIRDRGELGGEIYEVGTGSQATNEEVRQIVERLTGRKANLREVATLRDYDTKEWRADPGLIRALGWTPKHSLEETIGEMVVNYLEHERAHTSNQ